MLAELENIDRGVKGEDNSIEILSQIVTALRSKKELKLFNCPTSSSLSLRFSLHLKMDVASSFETSVNVYRITSEINDDSIRFLANEIW
jgi:hypothetical protein